MVAEFLLLCPSSCATLVLAGVYILCAAAVRTGLRFKEIENGG